MVTQRGFIQGNKISKVLEDLSGDYRFEKDPTGYYSVYNRTVSPHRFTGHLVFKKVWLGTYAVRELTNNDRFIRKLDETIKRHGGDIKVIDFLKSSSPKATHEMTQRKTQTSFERYVHLLKSNLEKYYATNDVKFLMTASEQTWMAFRQLIIRKAGLSKERYVPRKIIEKHSERFNMMYLYELSYSLHKTHYMYFTDERDATESTILRFLKATKR